MTTFAHRPAAAAVVAIALVALAAGVRPAEALDCTSAPITEVVSAIPARGEALLSDGRTLRLAGVRLADAGHPGVAARAVLDDLVGVAVSATVRSPAPDRWGRMAGTLALASEDAAPPRDVATMLVSQGLARVDPGVDGRLCDPGLLDLEEEARRARRGLWADAAERPLSAEAPEALSAREGLFTLVEGVVAGVGERERRTYLDFGPFWLQGFTAVIPAEIWGAFAAKGLDAAALEGRRIRVRGIIEIWRGPAVTVTAVETIEILPTLTAEPQRARP